jgi:hypothetical protein
MGMRSGIWMGVLLCLGAFGALAQGGPPAAAGPVGASERRAVVQTLTRKLQANYVFPDVAKRVSAALSAKEAKGGYDAATTREAFAKALGKDLRELGNDRHFNVDFDPGFQERPDGERSLPSKEEVQQGREHMASRGYGIGRVERLPGNVGYVELRGFAPTELVGDAYSAAMLLLQGSDALIVDLRRNGGGEPNSVAYFLSHFFPEGDERHLNDLYMRAGDSTRQYWTNPAVTPRYTKPVYVLTSRRTFSGGEECAYDFQTQKRATLVGETTGGGANPGDPYSLGHGFVAFISNGRAINPVTRTSWEHVGVKPDIAVAAAKAQQTAHAAILRTLLAAAKEAEQREELQAALARVEKGEVEPPNYAPPR